MTKRARIRIGYTLTTLSCLSVGVVIAIFWGSGWMALPLAACAACWIAGMTLIFDDSADDEDMDVDW